MSHEPHLGKPESIPATPAAAEATNPTPERPAAPRERLPGLLAAAAGVTFVLVGVAGFVPGLTTDLGQLGLAGHTSDAELLGVFQVSALHNVLHFALGAVGLVAAARVRTSVAYLLLGGIAYLLLWVYGLVVGHDSAANVVPLNGADNWLHLGLGLVMVAAGAFSGQGVVFGNGPRPRQARSH
ncbi:DUF4383 domain-containing protein [Nocardioides sp. CFH 31398]|uniref:DUF4383 domain-containing protein n=1 Tax=Nocardioides sp. CFH 31398 TaxID=2919579 RepID=UPI001F05C303|nr:DUF4383 domain-containing protein [Nocardioides sp. CFH 31398]MCH1868732.1 DUF4383 domain-containing protein [Nocardioides sp. CFH 31398]